MRIRSTVKCYVRFFITDSHYFLDSMGAQAYNFRIMNRLSMRSAPK